MGANSKECCEWRKIVELAIEKENQSLIDEAIFGWWRFSERNGSQFNCSTCWKKIVEWGKMCNFNLTDEKVVTQKAQSLVDRGVIKCCAIVNLIDLEDPNRTFLSQHAAVVRFQFAGKLCFKCSVKIEGILAVVKEF